MRSNVARTWSGVHSPWCSQLAMYWLNAQGGAIFHEPRVRDVRHLGTADALVDPAHHIAEDALAVVVQFTLDLFGG
jgi:hypothetical protein